MRAPRLLVQVITGGRPALKDRTTRKFLPELSEIADVEWCIREDHVDSYERDEFPFNVYTQEFANEYARTHWRHPVARWEPGGFFGAFPGREWAMRSGAERGYDLVLQLDDNIKQVGPGSANRTAWLIDTSVKEMASLAARLAMSTNAALLGFQLDSVVPRKTALTLRPGFPYSFFFEKTGPGRLPYYGPFEDDIMHAMEYGLYGGAGRTSAVMDLFRYAKVSGGKTGMRAHYNSERGLEIARRYPRNAKLIVGSKTSSPVDGERGVRHLLNTKGFTPVRVIDREMFDTAQKRVFEIVERGHANVRDAARAKIRERAGAGKP